MEDCDLLHSVSDEAGNAMNGTRLLTAIATILIAPDLVQERPPVTQLPDQSYMLFSPWTRFCLKGQDAGAKQVCFTGNDSRIEPDPGAGSSVDAETFKAQQEQLQAELQRRAAEARKKLDAIEARKKLESGQTKQ